jgi:hypothetical protein
MLERMPGIIFTMGIACLGRQLQIDGKANRMTPIQRNSIRISPFCVNRRQLEGLYGSPTLAKRMIAAGWIEMVRPGKAGREALYDYQSAQQAYDRFKSGENPPPLSWKSINTNNKLPINQ